MTNKGLTLPADAWIRASDLKHARACLRRATTAALSTGRLIAAFRLWRRHSQMTETARNESNQRYLRRRSKDDPDLAPLNRDQRQAVLIQDDRTGVIAAAGTGKTHTMVAKAHDTVRCGLAAPEQIAFVTFTRKAADEIRSRSRDLPGIAVGTIHHLARDVIRRRTGDNPRLTPLAADERQRLEQYQQWLIDAMRDDPALVAYVETRRQAFEVCLTPHRGVKPHPKVPPDDVRVKSMGEARIATILHLSNVAYCYEAEFMVPRRHVEYQRTYRPDFYIPDDPDAATRRKAHPPDSGIWHEHYAHDRHGKLPAAWSLGERTEYERTRRWKSSLHRALRTRCVETTYGDVQRAASGGQSFTALLLDRLTRAGLSGHRPPAEWNVARTLNALREDTKKVGGYWNVTHEIDSWIRTSRQWIGYKAAIDKAIADSPYPEEAEALRAIATPVLYRYEQYLRDEGFVDHESTILEALKLVRKSPMDLPWTVFLIDEYQDVNPAQAAFIYALVQPRAPRRPDSRARLTVVGDDWQAIFGFQGGDVDLIRRFTDPVGVDDAPASRVVLTRTYRFGQAAADSSKAFALRDPAATKRPLAGNPARRPDPTWPAAIAVGSTTLTAEGRRLFGRAPTALTAAVMAALTRIGEQHPGGAVLVLGRRRTDVGVDKLHGPKGHSDDGERRPSALDPDHLRQCAKRIKLRIDFRTIHNAKGAEADCVVLVDTGPPRAGERAAARALSRALSVFQPETATEQEERRLWYVALTRARYKTYLIVSDKHGQHSPFADELIENTSGEYDVDATELSAYLDPPTLTVACPACAADSGGATGAALTRRTGPHGAFAGCTSYRHGCGHTESLCIKCGDGLMQRVGNRHARCNRRECSASVPLCECLPPMPMVVRYEKITGQRFYGCQKYGKASACKKTKPFIEEPVVASVTKP